MSRFAKAIYDLVAPFFETGRGAGDVVVLDFTDFDLPYVENENDDFAQLLSSYVHVRYEDAPESTEGKTIIRLRLLREGDPSPIDPLTNDHGVETSSSTDDSSDDDAERSLEDRKHLEALFFAAETKEEAAKTMTRLMNKYIPGPVSVWNPLVCLHHKATGNDVWFSDARNPDIIFAQLTKYRKGA